MSGQAETDELLERLRVLEARVDEIERINSRESGMAEGDAGSSFLLAEFAAVNDLWRDADARIQVTVNLYLAMWATVAAAMVVFFRSVEGLKPLLLGLAVAATLLGALGVLVSLRIAARAALRNEYVSMANLIGSYFRKKHAEIGRYLFVGHPDEPTASGQLRTKGRSLYGATGEVIVVVNVVDALLLGMAAGAFLWLGVPSAALAAIAGVAIGAAVGCFLALERLAQRTLAPAGEPQTAPDKGRAGGPNDGDERE